MFHSGVAAHENVVQVDEDKEDASHYGVHELLEHLSYILESKWYVDKISETKHYNDSCFAYV